MKITLENIGQIKKAEIDLSKDLIVLCGGNNTGKTYAAYTVYGLFKYLQISYKRLDLKSVNEKIKSLLDIGNVEFDLLKILQIEEKYIIETIKTEYIDFLSTVFATSKDFFNNAKIDIKIDVESIIKDIFASEILSKTTFGGKIIVTSTKESQNPLLNITIINRDVITNNILEYVSKHIVSDVISSIIQPIFRNIIIEPAERPSTIIFSQELLAGRFKMIDDALSFDTYKNATDYIEKNATKYSLPINDSLLFVAKLPMLKNETSEFAYLADKIEKTILKGKMKISQYGEAQFNPEKTKLNLDINLTASGVKSLASIVFYLRHLAKVGDFYIIDEPELNLHPDNQRKIARIIAQMVNAGIKVMISTHSNYIIRELNNLIMLNVSDKGNKKEAAKLLKKYGYQKEEILDCNKVGAYLFTSDVANVVVTNLEVTNTGFEIATIDKETVELNESSADIFFTLHNT